MFVCVYMYVYACKCVCVCVLQYGYACMCVYSMYVFLDTCTECTDRQVLLSYLN